MTESLPETSSTPPAETRNPLVFCLAPIAAAPAILFILMAAFGATLPTDHVASSSAVCEAPPARAWTTITDFGKQPEWRPEVKSAERVADQGGHPVWREVYNSGDRMTLETLESEAPKKLVRKILADGGPFSGTWTFTIEAEGGNKSKVTITEQGKIENPIFRFVSKYMIGHTSTMDLYLSQLQRRLDQ